MASEPILGCIYIFAGNFAPRGYNFCDGRLLSIAQNTALFSLLGTTYGGDGVTTFALPDLRGRAPISAGQGPGLQNYSLGEKIGSTQVTMLVSQMPAHTHAVLANLASDTGTPQNSYPGGVDTRGGATPIYNAVADTTMSPAMIGTTGGNQPISTQNPILAINYIIAMQGIFPSRS